VNVSRMNRQRERAALLMLLGPNPVRVSALRGKMRAFGWHVSAHTVWSLLRSLRDEGLASNDHGSWTLTTPH
jgi:hypothetical protein